MGDAGITVVWIVGLAALSWFLFIRPRRRMMARQREVLDALSGGDQVVTVGGIYGSVVALDGDEVRLEIAPDVVIRVARRAVAGRVDKAPAPAVEEPGAAAEEPGPTA
jgi:preprotein translocase subunit YajC